VARVPGWLAAVCQSAVILNVLEVELVLRVRKVKVTGCLRSIVDSGGQSIRADDDLSGRTWQGADAQIWGCEMRQAVIIWRRAPTMLCPKKVHHLIDS